MNKNKTILFIFSTVLIIVGYGGYCLWVSFGSTFQYRRTTFLLFFIVIIAGLIIFDRTRKKFCRIEIATRPTPETIQATEGDHEIKSNGLEPIKYCLGHPDLNDISEGVIEIKNSKIIFRDTYYKNKVFLTIPISQVIGANTNYKLLDSAILNGMAAMGAERNYLIIRLNRDNKEHVVTFSTTLHNKQPGILENIKEKIMAAKDNKEMKL